jgi:hypothetical protein
MRILGPRRVVDVLAEWGLHEAAGRAGGRLPVDLIPPAEDGPERTMRGLEVILRSRSPLVGRIELAQPYGAARIEISAEERAALVIFDGRALADWTATVIREDGESGQYIRRLAGGQDPIVGPLVCTMRAAEGDPRRPQGPVVIYDGWHRAAAWFSHVEAGRSYPITADLILTAQRDPVQPI